MCDPEFEDCPTEAPVMPDFEAIIMREIYNKSRATDMEMLQANITLTVASMIASVAAAMYSFRYIHDLTFYKTGMEAYEAIIDNKTNFWKFANYILEYGLTGLYGFGAIFQLTAMFGVITKANAAIWDWVIYRVGQTMLLTYLVFMFMGYNKLIDTDKAY